MSANDIEIPEVFDTCNRRIHVRIFWRSLLLGGALTYLIAVNPCWTDRCRELADAERVYRLSKSEHEVLMRRQHAELWSAVIREARAAGCIQDALCSDQVPACRMHGFCVSEEMLTTEYYERRK